jgi:acyl-CoA synthetase (AMP-forming)/AMP-acid ligase II
VLGETVAKTATGGGVCVGRPFPTVEWRVIRITDEPIGRIEDAEELATGEIGELIVRGPQASPRYVTRVEANAVSKIADYSAIQHPQSEFQVWHRMGDVGYFDAGGRFWYCGRKSQRVENGSETLYTECVEAVFNSHPAVRRSALVGVGPRGRQVPVIVVECKSGHSSRTLELELLRMSQVHAHTRAIRHVLFHARLPVDVRHNAKINRETLAVSAASRLGIRELTPSVTLSRSHAQRGNEA